MDPLSATRVMRRVPMSFDRADAAVGDGVLAEYSRVHADVGRGGTKVMRTLRAIQRRVVAR
jgi:hypothetical protein